MKIELLALAACAALCVPAVNAQVTWTAVSTPVEATLAGGPWLLPQGGPYVENGSGTTTSGGPFDGTTPYCNNGVPIVNSASTVNTMQPFYFPFVTGSGLNLQGFFDYRPRNVNEAVLAATSADGGMTWTFEQQVENLSSFCPTSDANSSGNDDGEGHPNVLSFGGGSILFLLDRRNGWVDSAGLIVHDLTPKAGSPLNGLPTASELLAPTSNVIAQWNFETINNNTPCSSPCSPIGPNIGTGSAVALGMTNNYANTTYDYTGSTNKDDITGTTGGTNQDPNAMAWRIRGTTKNDGGKSGPGWNTLATPGPSTYGPLPLSASNTVQGVQFNVNTTGYYNIVFEYDWYTTAQAIRDLQAYYTIDGTNFTPVGPVNVAPSGGGYYPQITINFPALGIHSVDNNANFGVALLAVYDTSVDAPSPATFTGATLTNGVPAAYNDNSGNWRFDEINVLGTPSLTPNTITFPTRTTGLLDPDGIVAAVPNTYPFKILYIQKQLNADFYPPYGSSTLCGPTPSGKAENDDIATVRLATSINGITWTDQGPVSGLNVPTTVSYGGIRYVSPNGSMLKLSNGNYGLFFGAGNCLDGDSDSFHAIAYAESNGANLSQWTVINGINNPIASVSTVTNVTDANGTNWAQIPATAPVVGATQVWFGGRVYNPQATMLNSTTVNLNFSGYDAAYSADISDYRTIGQVQLTTGGSPTILSAE